VQRPSRLGDLAGISRARALGPPLAALAGTAGCCAVVLWADPTTPGGALPICPTKALLGLTCPVCGGLRMVYSLLHGDLSAALHYNALGAPAAVLFVWGMVAWTRTRLRGRPVPGWQHQRWTSPVIAVVLVAWFVVRNLPFAPFVVLRV
jgi:hypothetical protein